MTVDTIEGMESNEASSVPTVYEFGYRGKKMAELAAWLSRNPKAVLVDCRFQAWAPPGRPWASFELSKLLHGQYRHVRALGNKEYKSESGAVVLADPAMGVKAIAEILTAGKSPILMCACSSYGSCHRKNVFELLSRSLRGIPAQPTPLSLEAAQGNLFGE